MPTPLFILELREKLGHDLLWLSGVCAVVLDDTGDRLLLTFRADYRRWDLVSGILEPGEQPAAAIVREVREEIVEVRVERLAAVVTDPPVVLPNGDQCQFLSLTFRCRQVYGEPLAADDENLEARWFALAHLPELTATARRRLDWALVDGPPHCVTRPDLT